MDKLITVSAPGRICLFGEHQDYLKLPVITQAIDLRMKIKGWAVDKRRCQIDLPDIHSAEKFELPTDGQPLGYVKDRDHFRAVYNVLLREGLRFNQGIEGVLTSRIPINAGTSSSSALCVAWTRFLVGMASNTEQEHLDPVFIGRVAYLAEVEEFGEPGGMMDQYATALGGVLYQDFANDAAKLQPLSIQTGTFVLGDSLQAKDTRAILHRVKDGALNAINKIKKYNPLFDIYLENVDSLHQYAKMVTTTEFEVLTGALLNRDITREVFPLLQTGSIDDRQLGEMLNRHQGVLAKYSKISTPKIDAMLQAALDAGAYGGKINGSGGGGCMFAYAPESPQKVADAIEKVGGKAYIVRTAKGVQLEMGTEQ